jgi:BMFP domain-containing protein YqiC
MSAARLKSALLMLFCMTLSSCGPDFGDQIYKWVKENTRSYSEKLTRADLQVRWLNMHTESFRTISYYQEQLAGELTTLKKKINAIDEAPGNRLEKALRQYDLCVSASNELIKIKGLLDETQHLMRELDSIGSIKQFEDAGLRAVGKETLLRSFFEIGAQSEEINKLRYQKLFHVKYSLVIGEDGTVQQQVSPSEEGAGQSYSGDSMGESLEKFFADFFMTAPFYALFVKDDIEKQVEKVKDALNLFDKLSLTPKDQFLISQQYLKEAREAYKEYEVKVKDLDAVQKSTWKLLWQLSSTYRYNAETAIAPFKARLAEAEFLGSEEIQRIMDEESRFTIKTEILNMLAQLVTLRGSISNETDAFKKIELTEKYHDACTEAEYILKTLHSRMDLAPIYPEIERQQSKVHEYTKESIRLKYELIIH